MAIIMQVWNVTGKDITTMFILDKTTKIRKK